MHFYILKTGLKFVPSFYRSCYPKSQKSIPTSKEIPPYYNKKTNKHQSPMQTPSLRTTQ